MKNTLVIDGFLIFKHTVVDVKRYTVLIGPEASGKSIVAKLLYIFYHFPEFVFSALLDGKEISEIMLKTFEDIFPKNVWNNQEFEIKFEARKSFFKYTRTQNETLKFTCSKKYSQYIDSLKNELKNTNNIEKYDFSHFEQLRKKCHEYDWGFVNKGGSSFLIPAGRAFYAALNENIFSFLSSNNNLDYLIKQFGSSYESLKRIYRFEKIRNKTYSEFEKVQKKFLKGTYIRKEEMDYIRIDNSSVELDIPMNNASSGQQELLPVLMSIFRGSATFLMIEEPEAHIFPKTQYELIKFIVSQMKTDNEEQALLFTTHSPYVLTTMNNLVYAGILRKKFAGNQLKLNQLNTVYSENESIPPDELAAYTVENGKVISIIDSETGLINAEKIDEISDDIENQYAKLLSLDGEI